MQYTSYTSFLILISQMFVLQYSRRAWSSSICASAVRTPARNDMSSRDLQNSYQLKKISLKKKFTKFSQRISSKNTKNNSNKKHNDNNINNNKINFIFNGDVIINKNQLIEIKQNSINNKNINNKDINKNKSGIMQINNSNKDRDNSLKIINVNRNINLINKKLQNLDS